VRHALLAICLVQPVYQTVPVPPALITTIWIQHSASVALVIVPVVPRHISANNAIRGSILMVTLSIIQDQVVNHVEIFVENVPCSTESALSV